MRILHFLDSKDYDESLPRTVRNAVRAIILSGGNLVLIKSDRFGEYKFPGGGAKPGETHSETLIRETREETGLTVIPPSIKVYGMTREIHKDAFGDGVFEITRFTICAASKTAYRRPRWMNTRKNMATS